MIDKKLVTYNHCEQCEHTAICRHSEDYLTFAGRITDLSNSLEGDKIAEGIVTVSVRCNYYEKKKLKLVPRSSFEFQENH